MLKKKASIQNYVFMRKESLSQKSIGSSDKLFPKMIKESPTRKLPLEKIISIKWKGSVSDDENQIEEFENDDFDDIWDWDIIELLKAKIEIDAR